MTVGERIKELRKKENMTQESLASCFKMGVWSFKPRPFAHSASYQAVQYFCR